MMNIAEKQIAGMTTMAIKAELRAWESPEHEPHCGETARQSRIDYLCEELGRRGEN